jgi:hypothetical protein
MCGGVHKAQNPIRKRMQDSLPLEAPEKLRMQDSLPFEAPEKTKDAGLSAFGSTREN